jgi:hypothetical protein
MENSIRCLNNDVELIKIVNMPYTREDGGRLNNFAVQPKMYVAEPPNNKQKRNYVMMGVVSLVLVGGLLFLTVAIS